MNRRQFLRAGLVGGLVGTAGCLDTASPITWSSGVGSLHRPGAIRLDGRDPTGRLGVAAVLTDADDLDRLVGDEMPVEFVSETDLAASGLVVVQLSRPAAAVASVWFGPGGPARSGLRGLEVAANVEPWGTDLPDELADAERLEYTSAQRFDRPRRPVPRSATITLYDSDGDHLGRLEAD